MTWEQLFDRIREMPVRERMKPVRLCTVNPPGEPVQVDRRFEVGDLVEKPNKLGHPVLTLLETDW